MVTNCFIEGANQVKVGPIEPQFCYFELVFSCKEVGVQSRYLIIGKARKHKWITKKKIVRAKSATRYIFLSRKKEIGGIISKVLL